MKIFKPSNSELLLIAFAGLILFGFSLILKPQQPETMAVTPAVEVTTPEPVELTISQKLVIYYLRDMANSIPGSNYYPTDEWDEVVYPDGASTITHKYTIAPDDNGPAAVTIFYIQSGYIFNTKDLSCEF